MRRGYTITLSIFTIMILITITIGTSYSFYTVSDHQEGTNNIVTSCFDISFTDSNSISLNTAGHYAYPMTETNAVSTLTPYTFTVKNTCTQTDSAPINFDVTMNTLSSPVSTLTSYLNYRLDIVSATKNTKIGNGIARALTNSSNNYTLKDSIKTGDNANIVQSYRIGLNTLQPDESITYNLYMWIDENACNESTCESDVMGKIFEGKLLVYAYM